jgi:outer membrane protein assembly factor BamB
MTMKRFALVLIAVLGPSVRAADWPAWRGPSGQGFCEEKNLPLKWSDKENVRWKVPLAEEGNSTPVVWGDRIFLTQATRGGAKRSLLCLARADGKRVWQRDVEYADKERAYSPTWYCNGSPALDAERVVVSFASAGMYCFDHAGKELWKRTDLGKWEHTFGSGASPVLYGDLAILWCGPNDPKGRNYRGGTTFWRSTRKAGKRSGSKIKPTVPGVRPSSSR